MPIPNLKLKVKGSIEDDIRKEEEKGGKSDLRYLNFYDLKIGEKMIVMFVPDVNGAFWAKYKMHGPGLRVKGAKAVRCVYEAAGEECDACQKGFGLLDLQKETGDDSYKEEAKRWFSKDRVVASVIVLEAPMDITAAEDGNQVKLFAVPYNVEEHIKECIKDGRISQDELCTTPFVIKKSQGKGGTPEKPNASYAHSHFLHGKAVDDEDLAFLEDMVIEQFDYTDGGDVVPAIPTQEDVAAWLEHAEKVDEKYQQQGAKKDSSARQGGGGSSRADDLKEKARQSRSRFQDDEQEPVASEQEQEPAASEPEPQQEEKTETASPRDRLARLRNRG